MSLIKLKIKKGDDVIVIAGKFKGKQGEVLAVKRLEDGRSRVKIAGCTVKKHVKPNPQMNQPGGILDIESFIDISNVKLYNASTGKGDRVGFRHLEDGKKVRYFKSTDEVVDIDK